MVVTRSLSEVTDPSARRLVYSSPGPAGGPVEAKRFERWWEEFRATVGGREIDANRAGPFFATVEYLALGAVGLGRGSGSINRIERRRDHAAADGVDCFVLVINRSSGESFARAGSRSAAVPSGGAMLFDFAEPSVNIYPSDHRWSSLRIPRRLLCGAVPNATDVAGIAIPPENQALRLLTLYSDALFDDEDPSHPAVLAQAGQHLMDLMMLALGAERDNIEILRHRGLRAARLDAVLRRVRTDYADPEISPEAVAVRVGISTRYLHQLLHETGLSFAERIQELRLAKAFALLRGDGGAARKISDAAYAAGFNDLSHFNRLFRRAYGLTPTAARGDGDLLRA
jgi:AraC-like DNA-binding protein